METAYPFGDTPEAVVTRIDAIIQELQALRELVAREVSSPTDDLTEQLFGALGQGTWDEYDPDLDWIRFATP